LAQVATIEFEISANCVYVQKESDSRSGFRRELLSRLPALAQAKYILNQTEIHSCCFALGKKNLGRLHRISVRKLYAGCLRDPAVEFSA
jgi:hypothetical protein